ncbi:MAG TPA: GGDEF domain-containing protein [Tepidisphaeraceae bacterium]|nr:GGDEF domain-containing protein [Tepidisphaeraceae bacterium]
MFGQWLIAVLATLMAAGGLIAVAGRSARRRRRLFGVLRERAHTVNRLLDFSQNIQGAGKTEQVYSTLAHYLRTELALTGVAILTSEAEAIPRTQLKSAWPADLIAGSPGSIGADVDLALCPCLRQNLPRTFTAAGSTVRCGIDSCLKLSAAHPAYCIPFNLGSGIQATVHMLLSPGRAWNERRCQLAQAYVNTAQAALSTLNLLSQAEKQSMTDGLTGLYNRRSLDQLLEREVALADRHGHTLSLVMIDLDYFKEINDTHGHAAGDHMLKSFADCVRISLRKTDLAFRYGGDEFVIVLPQTNLDQAWQVMQKLRQAFMAVDFTSAISKMETHPTLSIGVTERSTASNVLTAQQMLAAADAALYAAKNDHRDCIKVFEPSQAA